MKSWWYVNANIFKYIITVVYPLSMWISRKVPHSDWGVEHVPEVGEENENDKEKERIGKGKKGNMGGNKVIKLW